MELIDKSLGPEAKVKVVVEKGKLALVAKLDTVGFDADVVLAVDSDYFLDELAAKIPGGIDDAVIGVLKVALKSL